MVLIAATSPYFGIGLIKGIKYELRRKKWRQFYNDLYRLKRQKRISVNQNPDGSYAVTITQIGKDWVGKYDLDTLEIKKPEEWDGFWRFFTFDIPAKKKAARYALLNKLKELGFIMVQRSLWAHPYECREELAVIAKAFEVEPHVHFFVAHDFDQDWRLRDLFKRYNGVTLVASAQ